MPYPEYKDSGVEWLGDVPSHWVLSPLGHNFVERRETVSDRDFMPLSVTMDGIVPQMVNVAKTDNGDNRKRVVAGDFVINSRSDRKGSAGIANQDGSVSVISTVLKPRGVTGRFAHFLLRSRPFQEEYYRYGTGIVADLWSTRFSSMRLIRLAVPALDEQQDIVAYLNHETAEIDAFIADQNELIGLLKERRAATITQAVTKGLDPNAPTKGSGVEWLGDVPQDWAVQQLSRVTSSVIDCLHTTPDGSDEGAFVSVRTGCIRNEELFPERGVRIDEGTYLERTAKGQPKKGDVFFTREAPVGEAALVPVDGLYALGQRMVLLKEDPNLLDSRFLVWNIYMRHVRTYIDVETSGSVVQNLPIPKIRAMPVIVPALREQQQIADYLDHETGEIDAAVADAKEAIKLSKERRAALISAAVTGKIDVRDHASAEGQA